MKRAEIRSKLLEYLRRRHGREGASLAPDTDLVKDWFLDSLAIVETVVFLEREFGLSLGSGDIRAETFRSVETLTSFVEERLG